MWLDLVIVQRQLDTERMQFEQERNAFMEMKLLHNQERKDFEEKVAHFEAKVRQNLPNDIDCISPRGSGPFAKIRKISNSNRSPTRQHRFDSNPSIPRTPEASRPRNSREMKEPFDGLPQGDGEISSRSPSKEGTFQSLTRMLSEKTVSPPVSPRRTRLISKEGNRTEEVPRRHDSKELIRNEPRVRFDSNFTEKPNTIDPQPETLESLPVSEKVKQARPDRIEKTNSGETERGSLPPIPSVPLDESQKSDRTSPTLRIIGTERSFTNEKKLLPTRVDDSLTKRFTAVDLPSDPDSVRHRKKLVFFLK